MALNADFDLSRRRTLVGLGVLPMSGLTSAKNVAPLPSVDFGYDYRDYWSPELSDARARRKLDRGTVPAIDKDVTAAERIIEAAPSDSALSVAKYFADLQDVGSTGEKFNQRWKTFENPVIVWFFHSTKTKPNGDCTSWCAAFISWSLERAGRPSKHSASSQAYLSYGKEASTPTAGDIAVFQNVSDPSQGHVALFLSETSDSIEIIGGNQGSFGEIPSCPKGYPISKIGRETRPKVGAYQKLVAIRRA